MLAQLTAGNRGHAGRVVPLLSAAEQLPSAGRQPRCGHRVQLRSPLRPRPLPDRRRPGAARPAASCSSTPAPRSRTRARSGGRYFPGFTEHEQRLHSQAAIRDAVDRTGGLRWSQHTTFSHPRSSTAERLQAQAEGRHYSTFSLLHPAGAARGHRDLPGPPAQPRGLLGGRAPAGRRRREPPQPDGAGRPGQQGEPGDQRSGPPDQRPAAAVKPPRGALAAARRSPRHAPSRSLAATFGRAPRSAGVCAKSDRAFVTEREAAAGRLQAGPADGHASHGGHGAPIVDSSTRLWMYLIAARCGRARRGSDE